MDIPDPAPAIADLLSSTIMGDMHRRSIQDGLATSTWEDARGLYCWERDALDYLAARKVAGDRPPINAWTAWLVEEGYPPEKAGPELHGKHWKPR